MRDALTKFRRAFERAEQQQAAHLLAENDAQVQQQLQLAQQLASAEYAMQYTPPLEAEEHERVQQFAPPPQLPPYTTARSSNTSAHVRPLCT